MQTWPYRTLAASGNLPLVKWDERILTFKSYLKIQKWMPPSTANAMKAECKHRRRVNCFDQKWQKFKSQYKSGKKNSGWWMMQSHQKVPNRKFGHISSSLAATKAVYTWNQVNQISTHWQVLQEVKLIEDKFVQRLEQIETIKAEKFLIKLEYS